MEWRLQPLRRDSAPASHVPGNACPCPPRTPPRQQLKLPLLARSLPKVTADLGFTNRPLRMIEEDYDVGILPGTVTDESVIARPAGKITLILAAAPLLLQGQPAPKKPSDLNSWPWIGLSGHQFWSASAVRPCIPASARHPRCISPRGARRRAGSAQRASPSKSGRSATGFRRCRKSPRLPRGRLCLDTAFRAQQGKARPQCGGKGLRAAGRSVTGSSLRTESVSG